MKPSREFTIKILSDEDFDKLPYPKAKESLGMSVMDRKTAFIRKTGVKDLDLGTIYHEFDELMAGTSLHEENGIRYKSGGGLGKILGPIVGTIVGMVAGPAAGAAVGAAIAGGTQAHSQSVKPEKYGEGFGGIAKSAALGGLGGYGGSSLINAGRVAATNAAIAGGTGNTAATFGAGLKGAASAAMGGAGSALTTSGKAAIAGDKPYQPQSTPGYDYSYSPTERIASPVTAAFAPQADTYLSQSDYSKALSDLASNSSAQRKSVIDLFRGQRPTGNTAYSTALRNADLSGTRARQQFIEDQRKLGSPYAV